MVCLIELCILENFIDILVCYSVVLFVGFLTYIQPGIKWNYLFLIRVGFRFWGCVERIQLQLK